MKKFIILIAILISSSVSAEILYGSDYVSPETYAVNEADMRIDYSQIPAAPKLNVDNLDDMRFNAPNIVEKDFEIGKDEEKQTKIKKQKKQKKEKETINYDEKYKKRLSYKVAKWWVDQRYKREEEHHGSLHEIKVQKRLDFEKKLEEEKLQKEQAESNIY